MPIVAWLAKWLLDRAIASSPEAAARLAKILLILAAALALVAGVGLFFHFHDKHVVAQHDTKRELGEAKTAIAAEHRATEAGVARDHARASASEQTQSELETIHAQDPAAAAAPASRGTRTVAKRLPLQP